MVTSSRNIHPCVTFADNFWCLRIFIRVPFGAILDWFWFDCQCHLKFQFSFEELLAASELPGGSFFYFLSSVLNISFNRHGGHVERFWLTVCLSLSLVFFVRLSVYENQVSGGKGEGGGGRGRGDRHGTFAHTLSKAHTRTQHSLSAS